MIFVTVGTQLAFDRMIRALDSYFAIHPDQKVFAQIGPADYIPQHMKSAQFISPSEADEYFSQSSLIIAHAGTGSIFTALKYKKPIIIMPRIAEFNEHRNDHQVATTNWAKNLPGVWVAKDEKQLMELLETNFVVGAREEISSYAQPELIQFLKNTISQS